MLISIALPLLTSVLILLYLESNVVYGGGLTLNDSPIIKDSTLNVELIYEGSFSVQPGQSSPVSTMTFLGSDILILSKNDGAIYRIRNGTILDEPLLDVNVANKRERGLLGITTSKTTEDNAEYIFVYYTESKKMDGTDVCPKTYFCDPGTQPIGNVVYRYEVNIKDNDTKLGTPKLLLNLPANPGPSHAGGVLKIGPDNNLYNTIGDLAGSVNKSSSTKAQNFRNGTEPDGRGGILRITQEGQVVGDGIIGNTYPLNLYYAYGIRNSFGIDFDPLTGNLWDTENGPDYGDEINLVEPGFNSGWQKVQGIWKPKYDPERGGDLIAGEELLNPDRKELVDFNGKGIYSAPEFTWNQTVGPTAIKFLNSDKLGKHYENDLFVGDNNFGNIYHFDLSKDRRELSLGNVLKDKIADNHTELEDIIFGQRFDGITDLDVGPDGFLYILSRKGENVYIYRIVPKDFV